MKGRDEKGYPLKVWTWYRNIKESRNRYTVKKKIFMLARLNPDCLDSLSYYNKPTKEWNI